MTKRYVLPEMLPERIGSQKLLIRLLTDGWSLKWKTNYDKDDWYVTRYRRARTIAQRYSQHPPVNRAVIKALTKKGIIAKGPSNTAIFNEETP